MLTGFSKTRWPRLRFSESYAVRISVKISRICEFRVIMGIMTGLLGCCSSSTLGSRANDYVKTLATLGFWLHHSPCSLGCWTNNTLAARSLSPKYNTIHLVWISRTLWRNLRVPDLQDLVYQQWCQGHRRYIDDKLMALRLKSPGTRLSTVCLTTCSVWRQKATKGPHYWSSLHY